MYKRLLALLLVAVMMMAACASDPDVSSDEKETASITSADDSTPETDYIRALQTKDYDGVDLNIACYSVKTYPNMYYEELTGEPVNDAIFKRDSLINELFGVNIVYHASEDWVGPREMVDKAIQSMEKLYDLLFMTASHGVGDLARQGALYDLNTLPYLSLDEEWWAKDFKDQLTINGKSFLTTGAIAPGYYYSNAMLYVNLDIAADLQFAENYFYSAVDEGKWTLDAFNTFIKTASVDLDGNSKMQINKDRFGFAVGEANNLFTGAGKNMTAVDSDGFPYLILDAEETVTTLDAIREILNNSEYVCDFTPLGNQAAKLGLFSNGLAASTMAAANGAISYFRSMEDAYCALPLPKLDEKQERYYTPISMTVSVPVCTTDSDMTALLAEAMAYYSYYNIGTLMYDITLQEKVARDPNAQRMMKIIYDSATVELNNIYNFGGSIITIRDYLKGKINSYTSAYEKIKNKAENELNEFIEEILKK
ncbi:MAG: hypothetical protein IJA67_14125 [Oscillospiraceae bacterium]|nr:hypothetical protein [Oscillospiraceae bacterium]